MKKKIQGLKWASAWMIAATAVVNLSGVFYNRFMSAGLGDDFAQLRSLMGIAGLLGALSMGLSTTLAKRFAQDAESKGEGAVGERLRRLAGPGLKRLLLACAGVLAAGPLVVSYLHLPSYAEYSMVALLFAVSVLLLTLRAALQGLHRFFELGLSHMAEGFGRGGLGWAFSGMGVAGGLSAMAAAMGLASAAALTGLKGLGAKAKGLAPDRGSLREVVADTACLMLLTLLFYLDEFTAKHYWDDAAASSYSRAALVAKSFLYLASALNMVLLPAVARAREAGRDSRGLLFKFLGAALGLNLFGLILVWWKTGLFISLLTRLDGPTAEALAPLTRVFSAAALVQALLQLSAIYLVAVKSRATLPVLAGLVALQYGALTLSHADPFMLVRGLGACAVLGLIALLSIAFMRTGVKHG